MLQGLYYTLLTLLIHSFNKLHVLPHSHVWYCRNLMFLIWPSTDRSWQKDGRKWYSAIQYPTTAKTQCSEATALILVCRLLSSRRGAAPRRAHPYYTHVSYVLWTLCRVEFWGYFFNRMPCTHHTTSHYYTTLTTAPPARYNDTRRYYLSYFWNIFLGEWFCLWFVMINDDTRHSL